MTVIDYIQAAENLYDALAHVMANLMDADLHRHEGSGKVFNDCRIAFDVLNEYSELNKLDGIAA